MDMKERMNSGELYLDSGYGLPQQRLMGKARAYEYNHSHPFNQELRNDIIQRMFAAVGEQCWIEPPIHVAYGTHTTIGDNFYANFNLTLVDDADIIIGNNVMFAPNVTISTAGHPIHPDLRHTQQQFSQPVIIEDGVWLGTGVIINPGVTIGKNSVIGAGSVVNRSIPANVVAAGVPCRVLRAIADSDKKKFQLFTA